MIVENNIKSRRCRTVVKGLLVVILLLVAIGLAIYWWDEFVENVIYRFEFVNLGENSF